MTLILIPYIYEIKDGEIGIACCTDLSKWDEEYGIELAKARLADLDIDVKEGWE